MLQTRPGPEGIHTNTFVLGKGVLESLPELVSLCFPGKTPWIVADDNTWKAAGERAYRLLESAGMKPAKPYIFPGTPRLHPVLRYSEDLAKIMPEECAPLAVGSGVINDLVKCASGMKHVNYCCVPTACSVDGYTATGGAMTVNGFKTTVPCDAPYALCVDTEILATAPAPMFAAGFGDLVAKVPGGADWILADTLGIEPIVPRLWNLLQARIREWLVDSSDMGKVFDGLAAAGYAIQIYRDSRPASGCEHLISHVWEMEGLQYNGEDVSHGFKVGLGTVTTTTLFEYVISHSFDELRPKMKAGLDRAGREAEIAALLSRGCYGDAAATTAMKKFREGDALAAQRRLIEEKWPEIQSRVKKQIIPSAEVKRMLKEAGCPTKLSDIGLGMEQYLHGIRTAQLIRTRYTLLDMLYETGILEDA
ncbi:MAG: sn-glycerol-1-phosphate dehydrogenase, partial [Victivallales bacterium]|nr:sn-glycerol-1-phosphate dehydrogenase [Victivallales bacterium]